MRWNRQLGFVLIYALRLWEKHRVQGRCSGIFHPPAGSLQASSKESQVDGPQLIKLAKTTWSTTSSPNVDVMELFNLFTPCAL